MWSASSFDVLYRTQAEPESTTALFSGRKDIFTAHPSTSGSSPFAAAAGGASGGGVAGGAGASAAAKGAQPVDRRQPNAKAAEVRRQNLRSSMARQYIPPASPGQKETRKSGTLER